MSIDDKRWAQKANELKFSQLATARKQAEEWRIGLSGLTALLTAVLIVKGRDDISELVPAFRWIVVLTVALALGLLVCATLLVIRAASGMPGQDVRLTGEDIKAWTKRETISIRRAIRLATILTVSALGALAIAIGFTWMAPRNRADDRLIEVLHSGGNTCGELIGTSAAQLIIKNDDGTPTLVPLNQISALKPTHMC